MNKKPEAGDHVYYRDALFRSIRTGVVRRSNRSWGGDRLMSVDITRDEDVEPEWQKLARAIPIKNVLGLVRELKE